MKKLLLIFTLLFSTLLLSSPSYAEIINTKPLWNQTNKLICYGLSRFSCTEKVCKKSESTALWKINFPNKKIIMKGSLPKSEYSIGAMYFKYYKRIKLSIHTIFLEGRIIEFNMDTDLSNGIDASLVDNRWDHNNNIEISSMKFKCHPE